MGLFSFHATARPPFTMLVARRQQRGLVRGRHVTSNAHAAADMFRVRSALEASSPQCRMPHGTTPSSHLSSVLRRLPLSGNAPVGVPQSISRLASRSVPGRSRRQELNRQFPGRVAMLVHHRRGDNRFQAPHSQALGSTRVGREPAGSPRHDDRCRGQPHVAGRTRRLAHSLLSRLQHPLT